jgi:NitT/TauT family transport system substrate-binding protein
MPMMQTRRRFLTTLSLASAAGLMPASPALAAAEPLETTTLRLVRVPAICQAPLYIAEDLLRSDGFTDIRYVDTPTDAIAPAVGRGEADFGLAAAIDHIQAIDTGTPIVLLGGVHVGCFELLGRESVRSITDLKGKSVGVDLLGSPHQAFVAVMAAHVGLDPVKDIRWVISTDPKVSPLALFVEGKVDAFLGFPPEPQDLRARGVGHVLVSTALDRPWSQYYCCMLAGRRDYVRKNPSQPSACCGRYSKGWISAPASRHARHGSSSTAASPHATTMRSRR